MILRTIKASWCLGFIILFLFSASANAQSIEPNRFVGRWISVQTQAGVDESVGTTEILNVLTIERLGDDFKVKLVTQSPDDKGEVAKVQESTFRLNSAGQLTRQESIAQTWEPSEFPKRVEEKIAFSKKGNKLILSTEFYSVGNSAIPGAHRKTIKLTREFSRADKS